MEIEEYNVRVIFLFKAIWKCNGQAIYWSKERETKKDKKGKQTVVDKTQKTKDWVTRTSIKTGVFVSGALEG